MPKSFLLVIILYSCLAVARTIEANVLELPVQQPLLLKKSEAHSQLNELVLAQMADDNINGLSISVIHDQDVWFSSGFGLADSDNEISASENTQYSIGSISSIFTAMLILQLQEKGLLSLSDPVSKHLPGLHFKSHDGKEFEITILQLLTHHSGLPLSILKNSWSESPPDYKSVFNGQYEIFFSQPPDTIYTYSNLGYSLLGMIIEKIIGKSYEEVLITRLLQPLGMKETGIIRPEIVPKLLAQGYKKGDRKKLLFPRDLPSLGMFSCVSDIGKLLSHINKVLIGDRGILSTESMKAMIKIQNIHIALDMGNKVGMGWMITGMGIDGAGPLAWRGGASLYHRSRVAFLPQKKLAVVVMANDSGAWDVAEKVSEVALELALESIYGIKRDEKKEALKKARQAYGVNDLFAPHYNSFVGYIPVANIEGNTVANLLGWKVITKPDGHGWFDLQYDLFGFIPLDISWAADIKIKPVQIEQKRVIVVLYKQTQYLFASYVDLPSPGTVWRQRIGKYEIANPDSLTDAMDIQDGEIILENEQLFFTYDLPMLVGLELKIPLRIIDDNTAIIPGLGTALNETIKISRLDGKEALEFSGYLLVRKINKGFFN